jgi:hypothetical protein
VHQARVIGMALPHRFPLRQMKELSKKITMIWKRLHTPPKLNYSWKISKKTVFILIV